ncbi:MAG: ATP-binding protein [Verrucomicrobiota bacterium]
MLIEFRVRNFKSFRDEQVLSLVASNYDKELPGNLIEPPLPGLKDTRLLKGAGLYGANASGKSNLLTALFTMQDLVRESADAKPEAPLSVEPFALAEEAASAPVILDVTFMSAGTRYEYAIALSVERVLAERLTAYPEGKAQLWYDRIWNPNTRTYDWTPDRSAYYQRDAKRVEFTRPNALYLSTAVKLNDEQLAPVYAWFTKQVHFLNLAADGGIDAGFTASMLKDRSPLAKKVVELLRHADLGVCGAQAVERAWAREDFPEDMPREMVEEIKKSKRLEISLMHRGVAETTLELPWKAESAGTRRFFGLAGPWLDVLTNGHLVCIDELDTSMHPSMVFELLKLVFGAEHNPKGAQIVFTTHNPILLDPTLMRRDQVWFTHKKQTGESFLYPLTDYKPRKGESLVRGYMSGRYGAVPFIPHGLMDSDVPPKEEAVHAR